MNDLNSKITIFKDPEGKFSLMVPASWKYHEKTGDDNKSLHQFEAAKDRVFQISVNTINDHISKIISANKLIPHDLNLPCISFTEDFQINSSTEAYSWMAVINDQFVFALYYFDANTKDRKNIGLELYDVRFGLRHIIFHQQAGGKMKCSGFLPIEQDQDYSEIENWRDKPAKYFCNIGSEKKFKTISISPLKIEVTKLYALLTLKVSQQPNGFFDLLKIGKPLDNTIWWDFVLECSKGYIHVWRTPFIIEVQYYFDGEFDVELFFINNMEKYKKEIEEKIKTFDRHTIYINHYQSYTGCVETLWKEIQKIDLTMPKAPLGHLSVDGELEQYSNVVKSFSTNSILYHALAKSLVLNAAFKIESFLNLIIRVGSTRELRLYPEVLSRFLKLEFAQRVKNLRFYSHILTADIDMGSDIYRETKQLMTLRNKYVHYDEDAIHNKLGEIFYDRDYPLHQVEQNRPAIDAIIKTYHQPDMSTVQNAYQISSKFVMMVESLLIPEIKSNLQFLIEQNPIGYNETKGIYSAVYTPIALDFFTGY